ncbi:hypothetical protein [Endozoicomonas sp. ONNA2]|uniref:hypothetical protein n=1 Tax=Endozoicomonas sp. ONNA2 TaxID=2828741 RepID=UPI0021489168|nr:hypothetical protein [Endozoicomonas sp. ONNA2]
MNVSNLSSASSLPPAYEAVMAETLGPEVTRFIESKGGYATELQSKNLLDYLIKAHNARHGQNYCLSRGSVTQETSSGGVSVAEKTRQKIQQKYPDMDSKIAEISSCIFHGRDVLKDVTRRNLIFLRNLVETYVQQELINVNNKCDRFKDLDSYASTACLKVDDYRAADNPQNAKELLMDGLDIPFFHCGDNQAKARIEALFKAALGIDLS